MAFPVQVSEIGNEKPAEDSLIIRKAKGYYWVPRTVSCTGRVCERVCVCVCALWGVVLLNVANSDAHADGSTEMVSVSKVPLAV